VKPRPEDTQAWASDVLRAGFDEPSEIQRQLREVLASDHPDLDPASTAQVWTVVAMDAWLGEAESWPEVTDYDRLQEAFTALQSNGVRVLQGCEDHWSARDLLVERPDVRGILWFTPPDVWHAIGEGMLEVNLWHADTANAAPGDPLLDEVIATFAEAGLEAHFDEGRIEVAAYWQRRPPGLGPA
jgi:hypothetical protein